MRRLLILAPLALLLSACGQATLNTKNAEKEIASLAEQATGRTVTVTCPGDVPAKKGQQTTCKLHAADGTTATALVVQTNDKGNVNISSPLMHATMVEQHIEQDAGKKLGFAITVTCPTLQEISQGSKVTCKASDAKGSTAPVYVTITSPNGNFTYDIPPAK